MHRQKKYDLRYRPESYWDVPWRELIKGQWRREVIDAAVAQGNVEAIPCEMFADALGNGPSGQPAGTSGLTGQLAAVARILNERPGQDPREQAGAVHPGTLGGEYLPDGEDLEVEIGRIIYSDLTCSVVSLRAKPLRSTIRYSIVDEYDWEYVPHIRYSRQPLSFWQFIRQINRSECLVNMDMPTGLATCFATWNVMEGGSPENYARFSRVESSFYPAATDWFQDLWDEWLDRQLHPKKYEDAKYDPLAPPW